MALQDDLAQGEKDVESAGTLILQAAMVRLYNLPLVPLLRELLTMTRAQIERRLIEFYREADLLDTYLAIIFIYDMAYQMGAQAALDDMGIVGTFDMQDAGIVDSIGLRAMLLLSPDSDINIISQTAKDLARQIDLFDDDYPIGDAIAELSLYIEQRTETRTAGIIVTEVVRAAIWGLVDVYRNNGVEMMQHVCEPDVETKCTTRVCIPLCGVSVEMSGSDGLDNVSLENRIPLHPYCRCHYQSVTRLETDEVWLGETLEEEILA